MPVKAKVTSETASGAKKFKVQIGVCKRLKKEVEAYEKEVVTNETRIQKMRDEGRDPYDIRKQEEVLQESYMMIPDSKRRLEAAIEELETLINSSEDEADITEEQLNEARGLIDAFHAT